MKGDGYRLIGPALAFLLLAGGAHAQVGTLLECGVPQDGTVAAGSASQFFTLVVPEANDAIAIRAISTSTPKLAFRMELRDPSGSRLIPRSASAFGSSGAEFDLNMAGNYTLEVIPGSSTASGTFRVFRTRLKGPCNSAALSCGVPAKGQIASPLLVQSYQIQGEAGEVWSIRLVRTTVANTDDEKNASFAAVAYDTAGQVQTIVDSNPVQPAALTSTKSLVMNMRLAARGSQTVLVFESSTGTRTGTYSVSATRVNAPCGGRTLACGSNVQATLSGAVEAHTYAINARAGDIFMLRRARTDPASALQPRVEVYSPNGTYVTPAASSDTNRYTFTAGSPGTYTVLVSDDIRLSGANSGPYAVSLARLNQPCNAQALACGSVADGSVESPLGLATYALDAEAGDSFLFRMMRTSADATFRPRLEIYDKQGTLLQFTTATDLSRAVFKAPGAGPYTVLAVDGSVSGGLTGAYSMSVARLNRPCGDTPLGCAALAQGSVSGPLRFGTYSYQAEAGDAFTVRMLDLGSALQEGIEVYDPQGNQAGTAIGGNSPAVDVAHAAAGAYTILAFDNSKTARQGSFAVQLFRTRNACAAAANQGATLRGLVTGQAPFGAWTLAASAGDALLVRSASPTAGFTAVTELFDPDGVRLGTGSYSVSAAAKTAGNYTVVVGASAPRTTGAYTLSWQALNRPAGVQALACGQTVPGALSETGEFRYYAAAAGAGDILRLLLTRVSDNFSPQVELYGPDGARLAGVPADLTRKVSAAGTYLVMVSPSTAGGETGAYALYFQKPNSPCQATALACGQTVLGSAAAAGQVDTYTFAGNGAGDRTTVRMPPRFGAFSPLVELYDPAGTLLQSGAATQLSRDLPAAGDYTLLVRDRAGVNTGTYRVALQHDANACAVDDKEPPAVRLLRPTGGEVVAGGAPFRIAWQSDDNVDVTAQEIRLSTDGGASFPTVIATGLAGNAQSYDWQPPAALQPSRTAKIQVSAWDAAGNTASASSDLIALIGSGFTENTSATFEYDAMDRLVKAAWQDGTVVQYTYDADGRLLQVSVTKP